MVNDTIQIHALVVCVQVLNIIFSTYNYPMVASLNSNMYIHIVVSYRRFPIDMAAFAVNIRMILDKPNAWMGYRPDGTKVGQGRLETSFLEHFAEDKMKLECRGHESEVKSSESTIYVYIMSTCSYPKAFCIEFLVRLVHSIYIQYHYSCNTSLYVVPILIFLLLYVYIPYIITGTSMACTSSET